MLNRWQQVPALLPLNPAAKAPTYLQQDQDLAYNSTKPTGIRGFAWDSIPWIKGNLPHSAPGTLSSLGRAQHPHPTTSPSWPTGANQPVVPGF